MSDPVMAADGHSYERKQIERWLATKSTSPMTGEALEHSFLTPNHALRGRIREYVFTWSDEVPNEHWAVGSGCATFYNTCGHEEANTIVERDFDKNTFQIFATRDIQEGDELRHVYKSKEWRNCFASLNIIM
ncbi:hypothetical protein EMIHUDRAFT_467559 [Emiliania huxleyi CCMP1516]|uniref:U-box domain-containing protein n=2 Tax=Emiliania huxleyi TaxID=2903 RepID=A0A0D3KFT2_EMIH1|nr:hypothetical protein EMIHUDRAFT_467559 [Emiliania huxleyi CCMP1516]EOD34617.1 hypothetical protein EMIHUDRAFT_467559 [Emiliania huxleyi CCMP1516]|eukprot:XP_005787046.1 hypothetical protein EMIHUDRAFT_467559 [Emiliania huxleyi CCMP1516]